MTAHPSPDLSRAPRRASSKRPTDPRGRRVNAAIAGGLAVLALVTCAAAAHRPSLGAEQATAVAADLRALYERIQGTPAQRTAALVITHVAREEPVRECMKSSGFKYTLAPFADPFSDKSRLLLPTEVSAVVDPGAEDALTLIPQTVAEESAAAERPRDPSYKKLSASKRRLYDDTALMCEPPIEGQTEETTPAVSGDLDAEFLDMLRRIGADVEVTSRMEFYSSCMAKLGYPVHTVGELYAAVSKKFQDDEGVPLRPESSLMPHAKAYQQEAVKADSTCRTPAWTGAMSLVQGELAAFTEDHADELAALDAAWATLEARAAEARAKLA
ncbi:hypothetical protein [Catellatospora vulcania]|uniref:hypothetical protein n=1 Tax=Catellatospora vulcania TaxID=1460450 RepID=UPI0012D47946|nr:hypothetical protein [Catellatospora vulcania]